MTNMSVLHYHVYYKIIGHGTKVTDIYFLKLDQKKKMSSLILLGAKASMQLTN